MRNALSIDVEEWFCVSNFAGAIRSEDWSALESRVEMQVGRILDILSRHQVKATFFILGWVAERHPKMVAKIASAGHEVATHGYGHQLVCDLNADQFCEDLARSLKLIRDITGVKCRGYRAPSFSIRRDMAWAWDILAEQGIEYDSSVFPVLHDRYGEPNAPRSPYQIRIEKLSLSDGKCGFDGAKLFHDASGTVPNIGGLCSVAATNHSVKAILEIPPSTVKLFGRNLPVAGGGYLRLFPYSVTRWAIRRLNREGLSAVVYFHPWELDPGQPKPEVSRFKLWRHRVGMKFFEVKLHRLLSDFKFGPVGEIAGPLLRDIEV